MSTLENKPASATVEALTTLWQRVLQLPSVGLEDNFFDLGGESATALELFNAIAQTFKRDLPPVMIYQTPTIASLAAWLDQQSSSRFPALVLLKPGASQPPVFITHGLGGTVIDFYQVVKKIQTSHPIHGMQARGVDGTEAPFDRIEDMAQYSLQAVRELQPHGPYLLIGYSLGGLVTLEMAQRLHAEGEEVALLAMLDAYPHLRQLSLRQRAQLVWQGARRRASARFRSRAPEASSGASRASEQRPSSGDPFLSPVGPPLSPLIQRMRDGAYLALERYRNRYYNGTIRFVRAATTVGRFPEDPAAIWGKSVAKLEIETVPGDHLGIMTTHAAELATVLSRQIREACNPK